jgi:dicarboxylate transporter 10
MLIPLVSVLQGGVATTLTQPIDVIKTRRMNARPGEFKVNEHIRHFMDSRFQNHIRMV